MAACLRWACGVQLHACTSSNRLLQIPVKCVACINVSTSSEVNFQQDAAVDVNQEHLSAPDVIPGPKHRKGSFYLPNRKERNPLTVLKILSGTTNRDETSYGYQFIDDLYTEPNSKRMKIKYMLAKISGKAAAQRVIKSYPECFTLGMAEPHIQAYTPPKTKTRYKNKSIHALKERLQKRRVVEAIDIYESLVSQGVTVDEKWKLRLFDLCCIFNHQDPEVKDYSMIQLESEFEFLGRLQNRKDGTTSSLSTWQKNGLAEKLFKEFTEKNSRIYRSIIRGKCKFYDVDSAFQLYTDALKKKIHLDREVHHGILNSYAKSVLAKQKPLQNIQGKLVIANVLKAMKEQGIKVNHETFELAMIACRDKNIVFFLFREMRNIGLAPSLTVWRHIVHQVFWKKDVDEYGREVFNFIMDNIENQKRLPDFKPQDSDFFMLAAKAAKNDWPSASRVYRLYQNMPEVVFTGIYEENAFYSDIISAAVSSKDLSIVVDVVERFVPHHTSLFKKTMEEIIRLISKKNEVWALRRLWPIISKIKQFTKENVTTLLQIPILRDTKKEDYELFIEIADTLLDFYYNAVEKGHKYMILDEETIFLAIEVQLLGNKFDRAWEIFSDIEKQKDRMIATPRQKSLVKLTNACMEMKQYRKAKRCVDFMDYLTMKGTAELHAEIEKHIGKQEKSRKKTEKPSVKR